ncbi:DUF2461 domain-containing protein [Zongyangia hominis]|uniref:DUF2461 domain-containing protein n=1 Tax=Zongyangia hominis TaxID=2763677 RepID=A0A926I7H8_9FIRM|nr:DUF2461 domain-containing protein [Zongyangia hominis]MBC8571124.1 DUF2461 domain-containing protein [Zongyangia hominis]
MKMESMLGYLSALEQNNNREWFHEHKAQYEVAKADFEEIVETLSLELRKTDVKLPLFAARDLTFKLQRDTRFSHDKSPYHPAFRAHISYGGKLPIPVGYYLYLRPGNRSFLGGGLFTDLLKDATAMVRDSLVEHGAEWEEILSAPDFQMNFTVGGTKLKNVPRGYDAAHPQAEYLKQKSWYLEYPVSDERILAPDFTAFAVDIFGKMRPFNGFLNRALEDFQMPAR